MNPQNILWDLASNLTEMRLNLIIYSMDIYHSEWYPNTIPDKQSSSILNKHKRECEWYWRKLHYIQWLTQTHMIFVVHIYHNHHLSGLDSHYSFRNNDSTLCTLASAQTCEPSFSFAPKVPSIWMIFLKYFTFSFPMTLVTACK